MSNRELMIPGLYKHFRGVVYANMGVSIPYSEIEMGVSIPASYSMETFRKSNDITVQMNG